MSTPPNIDSWQQSHTVCCVSPLVQTLGTLWGEHQSDSEALQAICDGVDTATRCDCLDENGGEPLEGCPECSESGEVGEVYEYWVIDTYLAGLLESIGEGLFDADVLGIVGGKVWCRTTSGQLIAADWAIETAFKLHCEQCYGGK